MKDFRIIQARTLLKITSVVPIRGFSPPSVLVLGERLNLTEEVTYNETVAEEFMVASPNRLIVKVPPTELGRPLANLECTSSVSLSKQDARVALGLSKPIRTVEGIDRLVQEFLLVFMSTPGSDIFNPNLGGGGQAIIGKSYSGSQTSTADLSIAVGNTKQQLLRTQAKNPNIPPSERLLSASLSNVKYDEQTTSISAVLTLRNVLGDAASVTVR